MEIRVLDFAVGLFAGIVLGLLLVWLTSRIRAWLGRSEVGRLASENRELKRRLAEKDRRISRMMQEAERLAEKLAQGKALAQSKMVEEDKQPSVLPGSSPT